MLDQPIDRVWVLLAAVLAFTMQAGFLCLETGLARNKNSINVAVKNLADLAIAVLCFWALGFGLMFGSSVGGWFGSPWSAPSPDDGEALAAYFLFQAAFCAAAATIVSGAIAERTRFPPYLIVTTAVSLLIYPVFGHWAWGGSPLAGGNAPGWLRQAGFLDFAGATVVHSVGGWSALAAALVVGPRQDRYDQNGAPRRIPPSNLTVTYLGVFLLLIGWFGFNSGSTGSAGGPIGTVAVNTILAASTGGLGAMLVGWFRSGSGRPYPTDLANGVLGGAVAITAGCAYVDATSAALIGTGAGALVVVGARFVAETLRVDDVVDAVAIHAFCGAWGTLAVALFAREEIVGASRIGTFLVQAVGVAACLVWSFGITYGLFRALRTAIPLRVSPEDESVGLNVSEHGATSSLLDLAKAMQEVTANRGGRGLSDVPIEQGTEAGELAGFFNQMTRALRAHRAQSEAQSAQFRQAMHENVQNLAAQASEVSEAVEEIDGYAEDMVSGVRSLTGKFEQVFGDLSDSSARIGEQGGATIQKVGGVLASLDHLTFQTRILALNASIEAARAGDAGASFDVVAQNIRKLAADTSRAAQSIENEIASIQADNQSLVEGVNVGVQATRDTLESLRNYSQGIDEIGRRVQKVRSLMDATVQAAGETQESFHR